MKLKKNNQQYNMKMNKISNHKKQKCKQQIIKKM